MKSDTPTPQIEIIGIKGLPEIRKGDQLTKMIVEAADKQQTPLQQGDILVVTSKVISLSEGKTVDLRETKPSDFALKIAAEMDKDARQVEVILRETKSIVRMSHRHLIAETRHGYVCANAGVDKSNVKGEDIVATLPNDPDLSCKRIRDDIRRIKGIDVAVVLADTFGRPLRRGVTNVAIGVAGLSPILDLRGTYDMYGYALRVTQIAVADELASAAELAMGKTNGIPAVIIRGYKYPRNEKATAMELTLPEEEDIFR